MWTTKDAVYRVVYRIERKEVNCNMAHKKTELEQVQAHIDRITLKAEFADAVLALVKQSGFLKPKPRRARKAKVAEHERSTPTPQTAAAPTVPLKKKRAASLAAVQEQSA